MITVSVNASKKYNVYIGEGIFLDSAKYISEVFPSGKIAVVTDTNVDRLYGDKLLEILSPHYDTVKFVFEAGEKSKNITTYASLLNFLAQNKLTRSDAIVAFGGGVAGDMAGFAAATYLRGIKYIQIPTTLLAMVDSSVGGKTAIDLDAGKNLAGAFYQPDIVICDYVLTKTLSDDTFSDGCSEIIKYSLIKDADLFSHLNNKGKDFDFEYVISKCVQIKSDIVSGDEFETGSRQLLNYGHTIGHAVEKLSGYKTTHGSGVAIGMAIISKIAKELNLCDINCYESTVNLIKKFSLPTQTGFTSKDITRIIENDKKRSGDSITFVLPTKIGECVLEKFSVSDVEGLILKGL